MPSLLEAVEFHDPLLARREVEILFSDLDPAVQPHIEAVLAALPDADRALLYLVNLKQRHPAILRRMAQSLPLLHRLVTVFAYSHFLADELLQNPEWLESMERLEHGLAAEDYISILHEFLKSLPPGTPDALALALFRRRQILRILLRDVLGLGNLAEITLELSNLADAILEVSYQRVRAGLIERHGVPRYIAADGSVRECGMAVIALGKLGGQELNYSSDIDLMFVYTANGETDGPVPISNKEFYKKVANLYTDLLSTYTAEGMCYRVDLRLRPDGSLGEVSISLEGAQKYYKGRARDWELQMLIKARAAAGDRETARELLDSVEPLTYSTTLDFSAVEAVSVTRERISEKMSKRRGARNTLDIKLARGGIRDIEFLTQCLQRTHGGRVPWVRHGGTLLALSRLNDKDLLSEAEFARLASAYQFLRNLEHRLQFEDDRQTHTLPSEPRALELLARKMPAAQLGDAPSAEKLLQEVNRHLEAVQEIYERVIHAQQPLYYSALPQETAEVDLANVMEPASSNLVRFLDEKAPQLAGTLGRNGLRLGARAFEHFLEKMAANPPWLALLDENQTAAEHIIDIFEHSPYFSDELIRRPELVEDIAHIREISNQPSQYSSAALLLRDASELRRFFRREMFRIQAASLCLRVPVFDTLKRTSDLADTAISIAYRMAVSDALAAHPPSDSYLASNQMMVIALGRLGLREFDLASDADLVFVIPDVDQPEQLFWTRVAGRIIEIISAYTGLGTMFAVDTRLRPNGGAGALVQTESAYKDYFFHHAEAWEGISYMKARGVAGDLERATGFLTDLQTLDWRRYGQSGRSKHDLRQMRLRLEKEQGSGNPLKAGQGGFYDIDFMLLYLRLKSAGIFYPVLNMPERIDIIEKMGHLERADAEFLLDAVTFYRAVDHGLRLYSGHAEGSLPKAEAHSNAVTEVVRRWTPDSLNTQPLATQLRHIREHTRQLFERLFA